MWDYLDHGISSLVGRHRILLRENNGVHLRILGMLLRFMLLSVRGTEGVVSNESVNGSLIDVFDVFDGVLGGDEVVDLARRDNSATDLVMVDDGDEAVTGGYLRDVVDLRDISLSINHKLALGGKVGSLIGAVREQSL